MIYTVRDIQARANALLADLPNFQPIVVDGMKGPATRRQIKAAMERRGVNAEHKLFNQSGLHRGNWHWSASTYVVTRDDLAHYNDVHDFEGNSYDGGAPAQHQANYDWRRGIGVSHTRHCNTGCIGQAVVAMHGAEGWPTLDWGKYPITWEGIDAMLARSITYHHAFDIPISRWSWMTHAEVQPTLGITQNAKWDYMVLPGAKRVQDPVKVGDQLRERMRGML